MHISIQSTTFGQIGARYESMEFNFTACARFDWNQAYMSVYVIKVQCTEMARHKKIIRLGVEAI
jgi:hypothetical protein